MGKHFELTEEFRIFDDGTKVFRIRATKKSLYAKKGDLGGFVQKLDNLRDVAWVDDNAVVMNTAVVKGSAMVSGTSIISGNAIVTSNAWVRDNAVVSGNALVSGNVVVRDSAVVTGSAIVSGNNDYCYLSKFGSENRNTTAFKSKKGIEVNCGCFYGTLKEFEEKVKETHKGNEFEKQYMLIIELIKLKL